MNDLNNKAENVKIAYIGGGSRGWAWGLMSDLARVEDMRGMVYLYDIDYLAAKKNEVIGNRISDLPDCKIPWIYKAVPTIEEALLNADFVVFAPGGVGTLDELAYDCVAMQDGFLPIKPFILFNVDGYFHHLVEYLKAIAAKGFADPLPFIVVDDSNELSVVFRLLKLRYKKGKTTAEAYAATRQLIYELPYFLKKKTDSSVHVEDIIAEMDAVEKQGSAEQKQELANEIEKAYLEKEIERMYDRLAKTGRDTSIVSDKLTNLKKRKKANKSTK